MRAVLALMVCACTGSRAPAQATEARARGLDEPRPILCDEAPLRALADRLGVRDATIEVGVIDYVRVDTIACPQDVASCERHARATKLPAGEVVAAVAVGDGKAYVSVARADQAPRRSISIVLPSAADDATAKQIQRELDAFDVRGMASLGAHGEALTVTCR